MSLTGLGCTHKIDVTDLDKDFLLLLSDREKQALQADKSQNVFNVILEKDEIRIEKFSHSANVHKQVVESSNHLSFTNLPLLLNSLVSKKIGLLGKADGLAVLSETSAKIINFLHEPRRRN